LDRFDVHDTFVCQCDADVMSAEKLLAKDVIKVLGIPYNKYTSDRSKMGSGIPASIWVNATDD
jgi:hypothetical protein